jgi:6,7-dimethyl-8-ribityllumazine synthase
MASEAAAAHGLKGIALRDSVPGAGRRVGIVHTQWNTEVVGALVQGARAELAKQGVADSDIVVLSVRAARVSRAG